MKNGQERSQKNQTKRNMEQHVLPLAITTKVAKEQTKEKSPWANNCICEQTESDGSTPEFVMLDEDTASPKITIRLKKFDITSKQGHRPKEPNEHDQINESTSQLA